MTGTWLEADCENGCTPIPGTTCCPTCDAPPSWYDRVACTEHSLDLFFGGAASDRVAVQICAICPVRPYCLEKGWDEDHGVWGGLPDHIRIRVRNVMKLEHVSRRQKRRAIRELASKPTHIPRTR